MCRRRKYYWVIIDQFGFEVSDYTGETCKFKTEQEAKDYLEDHAALKECHVVEYVHEDF